MHNQKRRNWPKERNLIKLVTRYDFGTSEKSKTNPSRDSSPNLKQDLSGLSGFLDECAQSLAF